MDTSKQPPLPATKMSFYSMVVYMLLFEHHGEADVALLRGYVGEIDRSPKNNAACLAKEAAVLGSSMGALDELEACHTSMKEFVCLAIYLLGFIIDYDDPQPESVMGRITDQKSIEQLMREPYSTVFSDEGNLYWQAWRRIYEFITKEMALSTSDLVEDCMVEAFWWKKKEESNEEAIQSGLWLSTQMCNPHMSAFTLLRLARAAGRVIAKHPKELAIAQNF